MIFKPNFKSIFGTQKIIENWIKIEDLDKKRPKIENLDKKDQKLKIRRKKLKIEKNLKNSEKFK